MSAVEDCTRNTLVRLQSHRENTAKNIDDFISRLATLKAGLNDAGLYL